MQGVNLSLQSDKLEVAGAVRMGVVDVEWALIPFCCPLSKYESAMGSFSAADLKAAPDVPVPLAE